MLALFIDEQKHRGLAGRIGAADQHDLLMGAVNAFKCANFSLRDHFDIGSVDQIARHARRCRRGAPNESWYEADIHRIAGEIALRSPEPDVAKAEAHFERALQVALVQRAKSWELRAAMSLARLWRDQGKVQQARELLAPVYGWFTEGFDTLDLKEAKALLEELAA